MMHLCCLIYATEYWLLPYSFYSFRRDLPMCFLASKPTLTTPPNFLLSTTALNTGLFGELCIDPCNLAISTWILSIKRKEMPSTPLAIR
jgi:hypothetical protein